MSPDDSSRKKQGFASLSPEQRKLVSAKGGGAKVPKGLAMLSKKERRVRASQAATARWAKERARRMAEEIGEEDVQNIEEIVSE